MGAETNYCYWYEDTVQRSANHLSNSRTIHFIQSINICCLIKVSFIIIIFFFWWKKTILNPENCLSLYIFSRAGCSVIWKQFKRVKTLCKLKVRFYLRLTHLFQVTYLLAFLLRKWKIDRMNPTVVYCVKKKKEKEKEKKKKLNCFNCFLSKKRERKEERGPRKEKAKKEKK